MDLKIEIRKLFNPVSFLTALHKWNKRIKQYPVFSRTIFIIQGTNDSIVDWKYNVRFLKKKIETVYPELIENARHQLVNENSCIRAEVFDEIKHFLEK